MTTKKSRGGVPKFDNTAPVPVRRIGPIPLGEAVAAVLLRLGDEYFVILDQSSSRD